MRSGLFLQADTGADEPGQAERAGVAHRDVAVMTTGLVMLNVQPFWQYIVVGVIVILAVLIDQARDLIIGKMEAG